MYVRAMGTGWKVMAAAAAVAGYLVAKHGPAIKKHADCIARDAVRCGLRASNVVCGWSAKARESVKGYVDEVRAEMASEAEAEQASPAAEQA